MSLIKQLIPQAFKFTPASADVNWTRIETLVHGPGASGAPVRDTNSAVFACLMAIATAYPEPPLTVYRKSSSGIEKKLVDHPLQAILDTPTPNGELSMDEILFWTAWAKHVDGNAYWVKVRSGNAENGNVVELWPISPTLINPVSERGEWISFYRYQDAPNHYVRISVANVIHFRLGVDDRDHRKGLAPLKSLMRQVATDDEADNFVSQLLKNYAIPGLVVIPQAGTTLDEDQADRLTERLRRKFGSENRGNVAVMSRESKVEQFGFSPKDLDMSILHRIPEERISAVMQVPAIVAGLGAGLDRATYANFKEAREMFTEQKLIPQWRADAGKLNTSLKPDFSSNRRDFVAFDLTNVRALQEDEDSKYTRLKAAVGKPWMTRNEARSDIGLDPMEGWDEEDVAPPEPPPAQLQPGMNGNRPAQQDGQPAANGSEPGAKALRAWRVWSIKRMESGKDLTGFTNPDIPADLAVQVNALLAECKTSDDVKETFRLVENASADPMMMLALALNRATDVLERTDGNGTGAD